MRERACHVMRREALENITRREKIRQRQARENGAGWSQAVILKEIINISIWSRSPGTEICGEQWTTTPFSEAPDDGLPCVDGSMKIWG